MQGNQEEIFVPASAKSKGTFERKKKNTTGENQSETGFENRIPPS